MPVPPIGPPLSFGWKMTLVLLVIAPPALLYDKLKQWKWRWERRNEAPRY